MPTDAEFRAMERRVLTLEQWKANNTGCLSLLFNTILIGWPLTFFLGPLLMWIMVVGQPLSEWQWQQMTVEQKHAAFESPNRERQEWVRKKLWGDHYK
jgi:hypothetical protein